MIYKAQRGYNGVINLYFYNADHTVFNDHVYGNTVFLDVYCRVFFVDRLFYHGACIKI